MNILFLHTLKQNIALFQPLIAKHLPQHNIQHDVQESFLTKLQLKGNEKEVEALIYQYLSDKIINDGVDYIVCTCSTLGGIVDRYPNKNVFRVDSPMAHHCSKYGTILVIVTLKSTIEPTSELIKNASPETKLKFKYIDGAWDLYSAGKMNEFNTFIANSVNQELQTNTYEAVVLAQASMTGAAVILESLVNHPIPILTTPNLCIEYLAKELN